MDHKFTDGKVENKGKMMKGRPKSVDADLIKEVRTVIDEDRRQIVRQVSQLPGISNSTVRHIISIDLGMSRVVPDGYQYCLNCKKRSAE